MCVLFASTNWFALHQFVAGLYPPHVKFVGSTFSHVSDPSLRETLGVQAWISIDFGRISGPPFRRFWIILAQQLSFFGMRVYRSRFLKILASESRCLRLQNQAFGVDGIAKTKFSHMSGLCRFWCHFYMVFDGFGINFDDFWWPEARLETS